MKKTSIGGQAVMEGVMMKNLDRYAVAVRKPDHEIEVMTDEYKSLGSRYAVLGLPIIRGDNVALAASKLNELLNDKLSDGASLEDVPVVIDYNIF